MRLISVLVFLLFAQRCHTWRCEGTCSGMDQLASEIGATCTKSADCLILTCNTPIRASRYQAIAKPKFQIYPCTNPVTVNLQIKGSFFGQTINENRNFTGDSSFPESMTFLGTRYTVYIHVTLKQMTGHIKLGMTVTYGSKSYTVIRQTDIPIDKSSCEGVSSTTHNPLCIIATPTQLVTTLTTKESTQSTLQTTESNTVTTQSGTVTKSIVNPSTTKSMVQSNTTKSMVQSNTTKSIVNLNTTKSIVVPITTKSMVNPITTGFNNENSTITISQNNQQLTNGIISGSVVVVIVILVISIISTLVVVYFIIQRRRKIISNFRYSNIKDELDL